VNFAVSAHDFKTASTIATSIVHSKLDYCNSLYHNLPNCQLNGSNRFKTLARAVVKAPKSTRITPILKSLHWLSTNASNINFSLSLTKFLQLLNLAIFTTLYLFNLLAVPAPHLLSLFLARQPSPSKSQIAHLDMHHLVFGINSQIHSVSLSILVSIHLSSTSQLISIIIPTLVIHHSFTPGSKPTFSTSPSHRRFLLPTGLPHDNAHRFIFSFTF